MRLATLLALLASSAGCNQRDALRVEYVLEGLSTQEVVRVETRVRVAPSDGRRFVGAQPFRSVAKGVGYEVRDFDGTGKLDLLISHDATFGYLFQSNFVHVLVPTEGETPPPLVLSARAFGPSSVIGASDEMMGTLAPGATVQLVLRDLRCGGQTCASDRLCCGGKCIDVSSTVLRCGSCTNDCGKTGDSCISGLCRCIGGSACANGKTCCSTLGCADLMNDPFNCGDCGRACNPGETCLAGMCKCAGGPACNTGVLCCDTGCSLTGSCPCNGAPCGKVCCSMSCVDTASDNANCGMCGKSCTAPLACAAGGCKCMGTICSGSDACCPGVGCRNSQNDNANCGMCGKACPTNQTCVGGMCKCGGANCAAPNICCNNTCINPQSSDSYCGGCNTMCKMFEHCTGGQCQCPGSGRKCIGSETCCSEGCIDLQNNDGTVHCGSCANAACPAGQVCQSGSCVITGCGTCTNGNICTGVMCTCGGGPGCTGSQYCCSGVCKDLQNDPNNCNMCGRKCGPAATCVAGACYCPDQFDVCSTSQLCCASFTCVDTTMWSNQHCGMCGNACRGSEYCDFGTCRCFGGQVCSLSQTCCGPSCCNNASQRCCGSTCCASTDSCCGLGCCPQGQACCQPPSGPMQCCAPGQVCGAGGCQAPGSCGGNGQSCCGMPPAAPCNVGLICNTGTCQPCGDIGQQCCPGNPIQPACTAGQCTAGTCQLTISDGGIPPVGDGFM